MEPEDQTHVLEDDGTETQFKVIPVEFVETYENLALATSSNTTYVSRGKYYKQTYRPAWESMPDFKGWLRGVEGQPTRAYCTFCHKTLHAHRLSLLKHTCTIRHQKAAQLHANRKNKLLGNNADGQKDSETDLEGMVREKEGSEEGVEYVEAEEVNDTDTDHDNATEEEEEHREDQQHFKQTTSTIVPTNKDAKGREPISTTVTDSTRGKPVSGLQVSLYKLIDGRWTYINEGVTNQLGKFGNFLERCDFTPGRYKLHYDVDRYFESRKQSTLYPFIEVGNI
nr:unnamed protein product [Callosobruchus chinensis]